MKNLFDSIKTFETYLGMYEEEIDNKCKNDSIPLDIIQNWLDQYLLYCTEEDETPECTTVFEILDDYTLLDHIFYCAEEYCNRHDIELKGREYNESDKDTNQDDVLDVDTDISVENDLFDTDLYSDTESINIGTGYEYVTSNDETENIPDLGYDTWNNLRATTYEHEEDMEDEIIDYSERIKNFETYGYSYEEEIDEKESEDESNNSDKKESEELEEAYKNIELSTKRDKITSK